MKHNYNETMVASIQQTIKYLYLAFFLTAFMGTVWIIKKEIKNWSHYLISEEEGYEFPQLNVPKPIDEEE